MPDETVSIRYGVDQVKAFMLFAYSGGDLQKTAAICQVPITIIQSLAHDFNWLDKIKGQNRLDTPEGLKAEQEANRAANYVIAQRYRKMLESVILDTETNDRFADTLCVELVPIPGTRPVEYEKVFTGKPILELAKAVQVVNDMTYRALGDRVAGQADVTPRDDPGKSTNLAVHIYAGLEKMKAKLVTAENHAPSLELEAKVVEAVEAKDGVTEHVG